MKGAISVEIPTKPYIKAYLISKLGDQPLMSTSDSLFANKLYDLLQHQPDENIDSFENKMYTTVIKVYVPIRTYKKRGSYLNIDNIKRFNSFVEREIKSQFYYLMTAYQLFTPSIVDCYPLVRKHLGIDIEIWSDDSMKKDYYRYRKTLTR